MKTEFKENVFLTNEEFVLLVRARDLLEDMSTEIKTPEYSNQCFHAMVEIINVLENVMTDVREEE